MSSRVPIYRGPGVYLLFIGEAVVYIGKSNNVLKRIADHATKGRPFDSYAHIECGPDEIDALEVELIKKFLPAGNSAGFHKKRENYRDSGGDCSLNRFDSNACRKNKK